MEPAAQQIAISDAAQAHLRKLLDTQEEGTNIRMLVVNPDMPNAECGDLIAHRMPWKKVMLK